MVYSIIAFLVAITIHEAAHALVAYRLGDPTAKMQGRLTLNPIAHMDLYGTVLIPLMLIFIGSPFVFGWAKPVLFDPYNLAKPRRDSASISFAGPFANFSLALFLSLILWIIIPMGLMNPIILKLFITTIAINVTLALFNLIPIHPLDGGKIFVGLLNEREAEEADLFLRKYGMIILFLLIFPIFGGVSPLSTVLNPAIRFILSILIPSFGSS